MESLIKEYTDELNNNVEPLTEAEIEYILYEYQGNDGGNNDPPINVNNRSGMGKITKATVENPKKPSQLLFISDIEGCLEKQGQINQNVSLCDLMNYLPRGPLFNFLLKNSKNKIAFLGDYFDKGPGVASSIKGITFLHKCFPDRVHIILGNRDVNKFRLGYEVIEQQRMSGPKVEQTMSGPKVDLSPDDTKWNMWLKKQVPRKENGQSVKDQQGKEIKDDVPVFYHPYHSANTNFERFKIILEESMGAAPINIGAIISYSIQTDANAAKIGAYYLTKVFDDSVEPLHFGITDADISKPDLDTFVNDCRYLFKNGDIVKGDDDYKVLMSHAGGFNKCILKPESFYNGIMGLQNGRADKRKRNTTSNDESHKKLKSESRNNKRKNQEPLNQPNKKQDIFGGDPSNPNYFDEMERMRRALTCNGDESVLVTITDAVTNHNNLYKNFVNAYFNDLTDRNTLLPQHLLLQAMGLKPDGPPSKFASFIQSCGSGCGIVNDDNESNEFISKLGTYKAVAHGHVPHCMRHPLLINRNDIVFISNDTSNGNRPKNSDESLSSLPLSYIQRENVDIKYGICFIEKTGTIRIPTFDKMNFKNDNTLYSNQNDKVYKTLALIDGPYSLDKIPTTNKVKTYMKWNGFAPGDIDPPSNIIDHSIGGSSTRKNQKRGGKKNTRRIVKNNRKTKRRSKHHCSHCK